MDGLRVLPKGFSFLGSHPRLWTWIVIPLSLNFLLMVAMVWASWAFASWLAPELTDPWWSWIDWLRPAVRWTTNVLMVLLAALAGLFLSLQLASLVNAPFFDLLSEKTEDAHLGIKDPGRPWSAFAGDTWHSVRAALSLLMRQVLVMTPLFILSFTAVGAPIFFVAGLYYSGLAVVDVTLARKRLRGSQRFAWGRRHWKAVLGVGLPVGLLPPLAPFSIVGATALYLDGVEKN
jgi:uncharacterized protein involved in cysteine biosynthesis